MNQQLRVILAVVLSLALYYVWSTWFIPKPPPRAAPDAGAVAAREPADAGQAGAVAPPASKPPAPPHPEHEEEVEQPAPEQTVQVETPLWKAVFSTRGAALASFELTGRKQSKRPKDGKALPVNLAHPGEGQPLPLSTDIGDPGGGFGPESAWKVARQGADELVFERSRGGLTVTKRYSWKPDGYLLGLEVSVRREGGGPAQVPVNVVYPAYEAPGEQTSSWLGAFAGPPEVVQAVCHLEGERSVETYQYDAGKPQVTFNAKPTFAGIDQKYFIAAVAPREGTAGSCTLAGTRPGAVRAVLTQNVAPTAGAAATAAFDVYLGPKDDDRLAAVGHNLPASIDFGFWAVISRLLLAIMKGFYAVLHNWGLAIVALTLLVKAITFPLTHKQMKSMEEMRRLTPLIEKIKEKHKGDQQAVNQATMKLYQEHKVNPMGGCLPMLIQMPVWFALYAALSASFDLYNEPFIPGWINDLTVRDPYYITPVLMTATMLLSQVLMPQPQQNEQMKVMMWVMPIFFGVMMLALPAGLVLYIFTNNVLSIAQSLWFRRKFGQDAPATAEAR